MSRATGRTWAAAAAALVLALGAAGRAGAAGLLVPRDEAVPPLAVKYLRVDATIDNQAATTRVVQEFQNSTKSDLECTYIFPLPKGAAVRDFAMYIGGKRMKGELVERDKARQVYEEIVRRTRDPGLLEYMDGNLLRMRIFPVPANGTQKVELEYTELLPLDGGLAEYVFPLRVGEKASRTLEDFTVAVRIRSGVPIKSVYSPSHEVGVSRPNDREAVAGMEAKGALLDRDFHLFYTVGEKDFGLNLMAYRPDPDKPGMFLMLLSPRSEVQEGRRVPRDVVFVLDTSGSMKGEKIEQAKKALHFCIDQLDPKDRFAVVQFSTMAEPFAAAWTDATDEARAKAREWVRRFEASGGTNVGEALQKAFALPVDPDRPTTLLFITDGRPTVDVTDIEALSKLVKDHNRRNLRIFTFGVGDDVNTHLLDRMANETGGLPEYVRPSEAIDGKVTRLFAKMSHPVLTELSLEVPGVRIAEVLPRQLPDLFRGSQVVLVGTYTGDGDSVIRLRGRAGHKTEEFTYEGTFPKKTTDRAFIAALYAQRKIGFLLDQIRLHGEERELKDEIIRLSLAHGIETPYTSYLVLENEAQYRQYGITVSGTAVVGGSGGGQTPSPPTTLTTAVPSPGLRGEDLAARSARAADRLNREFDLGKASAEGLVPNAQPTGTFPRPGTPGSPADEPPIQPTYGSGAAASGVRADAEALRGAQTGEKAVEVAQQIQRLRQTEKAGRDDRAAKRVQERAGRRLVLYRGVWVDEAFQGTEKMTKVKWGSEAYFRLARERADLREAFSLGQRVVVVTTPGQAVAVDPDEGAETLSDEAVRALMEPAAK